MVEALLALSTSAGALLLAWAAFDTHRVQRRLAAALRRRDVLRAEARRLQVADTQLAEAQRLAEAAVWGGTHTVRAVHRGIAAIPFGILEAIPATRDVTRVVRASHDLISDAVYGSIDLVNRGVGAGLRAGLKAGLPPASETKADDPAPPPVRPPEP